MQWCKDAEGFMTQTSITRVQSINLERAIVSGLACLGGISLLTGGNSLAQTAGDPVILEPAPVQPVAPIPAVAPAPIAPPEPIPRDSFPSEFSAPAPRSVPVPTLAAPAAPTVAPTQATDGYIAPNTIIFSERSSGCRAVLSSGQSPQGGLCGGGSQPSPSITPLAIEPSAFSISQPGISSVTALSGTGSPPSLRDFYRRTLRPPAKLGNGNIRLVFPLSLPAPISSVFGWRMHPITGDARFHTGTDLAAPLGTPVLAAYAGQVAIADFLGGYGLAVAIDHNKGMQQSLYAHLSEVFVRSGDVVKQGEVIGRVGSTGNSTGPHLHFEFRQQTSEGWVALDAGAQLEYALAQLVNALELAQVSSPPTQVNAGVQGVIQ